MTIPGIDTSPVFTYVSMFLNIVLIPGIYKIVSIEKKIIQLTTLIKNNCPNCTPDMKKEL